MIRRFATWLLTQMFRPTGFKAGDPARDEQMASLQLYSTRRRDVMATPLTKESARAVGAAGRASHKESGSLGCTR